VYILGPCTLELVGLALNFPAQPDPDEAAHNWPTDVLEMGLPILMLDGATWHLNRPPVTLQDGRVQVQVRGTTRASVTLNVAADCLSEPIWNVGYPYPVPEPIPDPVIVPEE
jgi:hypothetical protein